MQVRENPDILEIVMIIHVISTSIEQLNLYTGMSLLEREKNIDYIQDKKP